MVETTLDLIGNALLTSGWSPRDVQYFVGTVRRSLESGWRMEEAVNIATADARAHFLGTWGAGRDAALKVVEEG